MHTDMCPNHSLTNKHNKLHDMMTHLEMVGASWWLSGKESACQCRRPQFNPWSWKIPHTTEPLSLHAATIKPVLWSLEATTTEPVYPRARALQREATAVRSPCTATRE